MKRDWELYRTVSEHVDWYSVFGVMALSLGAFEFGRVRGFDKGYEYAWKEISQHQKAQDVRGTPEEGIL